MTDVIQEDETGKAIPRESLLVKLAATFGSQIGVFIFGIGIQIAVARALGPSGKGLFSLASLTANTLVILIHCSLSAANSHFAGRYPVERRALVGNSFLLAIVWGAVIMAVTHLVLFDFVGE